MSELNFLKTTRNNEDTLAPSTFDGENCHFQIHDTGIIEVTPKSVTTDDIYIISCGIHGNETAPIEFTNETLEKIYRDELSINSPTLFIFGNPKAMNIGKRFSEYNLNRCFNGAYKDLAENYEVKRASVLEKQCYDFVAKYDGKQLFHFDLHCALKKSEMERFALVPKSADRQRDHHFNLALANMGVQASLFSHKESTVFSSFSFEKLNAYSATVELGKVYPFGQNPEGKFRAAQETIESLLSSRQLENKVLPKAFTIYASINKEYDDFSFTFEEEESANFTLFKKGDHIFTQNNEKYLAAEDNLRMIFPNSKVILGQRALLLIKELE
ncbi:succinylglutamate desuccinylase [Halobacteriovorax sp. CON-3]|uniref:succinylglutamate desuccinylase n=1 Tax=Halobacteriovorax sp. CON-3 TaxID=3157710 RepID=UPI00372005BA